MSSQHNFPGVYPVITDLSQVVNSNSVTSCGFVGEAEFGPINKPTLISSLRNYTEKFGVLSSDYGYMGLSLAVAADSINSHYVVRVVDKASARYGATAIALKGKTARTINAGYTIDEINAALEDSSSMFIDPVGTVDENSSLVVTLSNPNNRTIKVTTADTTINTNKNIKASNVALTYSVDALNIENGGSGYAVNDTITFNTGSTTSTAAVATVLTVDTNGAITSLEITNAGNYSANITGIISPSATSGSGVNSLFTAVTKLTSNNISITINQENQFAAQDTVIVTDSNSKEYEGTVTTISDTYGLATSINAAGTGYNVGDVVTIGSTGINATITSVDPTSQAVQALSLNTTVVTVNPGTGIYETSDVSHSGATAGTGLKVLLTVTPIHNVVNILLDNSESFIYDNLNNIRVLKQIPASEKTFSLSVYEVNGKVTTRVEYYQYLTTYENLDSDGNSTFVEDVINGKSQYIYVFANRKTESHSASYPQYPVVASATLATLNHGTSGNKPSTEDLIKGWDLFKDRTEITVTLLMNSGYVTESNYAYQSKMLEIAEKRRDCFCLFDIPMTTASNYERVLDWRRNVQGFNTYRGSLTSPWVKTYNSIQGKSGFLMAPSAYVAKIIGTNNPWMAPAGPNRGIITSSVVNPIGLTEAYDDTVGGTLYDSQINSIVRNPGAGWAVWGQKTLQQKPSALDRINVARTVIYIETTLRDAARYHLFENNTAFERMQITLQFNQFLDEILAAGGITKYQVVCDESNNTAQVRANNTLVIDIYIWPTLTAEYIELNSVIMGQDATVTVTSSGE